MRYIDKDLESIQEIRNLLLNGQMSFVHLEKYSQEDLDAIISIFIKSLQSGMKGYVHDFVAGNDYGVEEDELFLCTHFIKRFGETLQNENYVGIIGGNPKEKCIEIGAPLGVVAVILPSHPTFTLLVNLCLLAMKTGNAMVFIANKRSTKVTLDSLKKINYISRRVGIFRGWYQFRRNNQ